MRIWLDKYDDLLYFVHILLFTEIFPVGFTCKMVNVQTILEIIINTHRTIVVGEPNISSLLNHQHKWTIRREKKNECEWCMCVRMQLVVTL